jgi:hypothetical protein
MFGKKSKPTEEAPQDQAQPEATEMEELSDEDLEDVAGGWDETTAGGGG